jgi:hypothetical protein
MLRVLLPLALLTFGGAAIAQAPTVYKPGKETKLLAPLVGTHDKAGKKHPPMMKPVDSEGTMKCAWTAGDLWLACDLDEKIKGGPIDRFTGHLVVGWDFVEKGYRAFLVSNQGLSVPMNGWTQGGKLIFQSQEMSTPVGKMKMRWTFDFADKKAVGFHDERSIGGMDWFTFEETTIR